MNTILILAFAPGVFWLWYFYKRDSLQPEPKGLIIKMFIYGMVVVFPAALVETVFSGQGVLVVILFAPVVEELSKYLVVKKIVFHHAEFDEPMDGIVYSAAVALGFASMENVGYLVNARSGGILAGVFVGRAFLSVPGHVLFSSMWGYALGLAKFSRYEYRNNLIRTGLVLAILLHGVFNFLALYSSTFAVGMVFFVLMMWSMVNRRIRTAMKISERMAELSEDED
ncbi:MAG: hypothetical protein HPY66_3279 [Firmicutes bacterium]|nr:hypothetical protein [Bacillota bacterium]MDI6705285.1 PrsW family glutamic-type intramembrane protease [Bacillota bacterium]